MMLWCGSPTAADSGLKIRPVRVRIPLALPAVVDAATLKVKLPCMEAHWWAVHNQMQRSGSAKRPSYSDIKAPKVLRRRVRQPLHLHMENYPSR